MGIIVLKITKALFWISDSSKLFNMPVNPTESKLSTEKSMPWLYNLNLHNKHTQQHCYQVAPYYNQGQKNKIKCKTKISFGKKFPLNKSNRATCVLGELFPSQAVRINKATEARSQKGQQSEKTCPIPNTLRAN